MKTSILVLISISCLCFLNGCGTASQPRLVATHLSVTTASTSQIAGTAFNITVTALDASNALVSTYAGTVQFASTDTQAVLPASSPLTHGTGTFSVTLKTATSQPPGQSIAVVDAAGQLTSGTINSIVVNAASASQLSVTGPPTANAGAATSFTVTAQDQFGNNATTYSGTLRFTSSDPQAILPANAKLTMGAGAFSITLNTVGSQTTTATDVATPSITGTVNITIPPVSVMVSPPAQTVFLGAMQTFTANVGGTINTAATWTVQEGPAGGSITNLGVYTAPQVVGTYHVIATSVADSTKSGTAIVTVPPVTISMSPASDTLGPAGKRTFLAAVTGASNTAVTWSIEEGAAGGTVDVNGNYVAPTTQGTFHLLAVSVADSTKNATATVTIVPSGFFQTGSMTTPRFSHTATLLNTGKALLAGGIASYKVFFRGGQSTCSAVATDLAELFDPAAGTFAATGAMNAVRVNHTSTLLQDGKVLVTGGDSALQGPGTAEIFDPATAAFTPTGNMISLHSHHAATLLPSGKVLITGGVSGADISEVFDPALGAFAATGSMSGPRFFHTATLLPNGKVLVVGGIGLMNTVLSTSELYDPVAGTFAPAASMATARRSHTATLLPSGAILIAGGFGQSGAALSTAEIYNPVAGMSAMTGSMNVAHSQHTATLLPSGKVLIAGGGSFASFVAELFDPAAGTFSLTGSMLLPRTLHTATLLPNGQVVVAGSQTPVHIFNSVCHGGADASAELYH
jgi:hypothetical protein